MTTADALRGMAKALRRIGVIKRWPWGYTRGSDEVIEWICHSCHGLFADRGDENGQCPVKDDATCPSAIARAALAAWESRTALVNDDAFIDVLEKRLTATLGVEVMDIEEALLPLADAIDTALTGTGGTTT